MVNKRETIMAAIETQMGLITRANGYNTDIGAKVKVWYTDEPGTADMPCLIIGDGKESVQPLTMAGPNGTDEYTITVEFVGYTNGPDGSTSKSLVTIARQIIEDILKAIKTDLTLGGKSSWTKLTETDLDVQHGKKNTAAAKVVLEVVYRTNRFDYTT